jgi:hypothetical protein
MDVPLQIGVGNIRNAMFKPLADDFMHAFEIPSKWVTLRKIEIPQGAVWKLAISHANLAF